MGNSEFDFQTFDLSTIQMSQHPKMGPLDGLHAIANWAKFKLNFYLRSIEKIKEFIEGSAAQCLLLEFQATGVQPPMTFPYQVSMSVIVSGTLSDFLWNSATQKSFSVALQSKLKDLIFFLGNNDRMQSCQFVILLQNPGISLTKDEKDVDMDIFSFFISKMQSYLILSILLSKLFSVLSHSSSEKFVYIILSQFMNNAERTQLMKTPEMLLQLFSLIIFMKFILSGLKPNKLTHFLKLRCSYFTFLIKVEKTFYIYSWSTKSQGILVFGFQQIMLSSQDHNIFQHFQWKRAHQLLVVKPCQQIKAGLRQLELTQIIKHGLPYIQSGQFLIGFVIL